MRSKSVLLTPLPELLGLLSPIVASVPASTAQSCSHRVCCAPACRLQVCVTTPFQIICALCFAWTLYGMAGMRHGGEYIGKWGCIVTLVYLISVQVLHACAIFAPNQDTAFMMSIVWTTVQMLVSTFFVNFSEVRVGAALGCIRQAPGPGMGGDVGCCASS